MEPANINIDLTQLVLALVREYGIAALACFALFYYAKETSAKLDRILDMDNRVFGVMISLLDKKDREKLIELEKDIK